ncbi:MULTISPECIES: threonine synthase [unclassified Paenibacillus]|uniref:threonine synthase n=1 Tax=unclassified Paenibacillus TaxID=185978 RepID=UPI001AE7E2B0|nr:MULTISPECIES: threonine synthase [unclassified Paenibacillus]MBP1154161.1 threonine synthase [Paenibacillus sp. PvP091]MBP1170454.1 threonine synthase [Paenibacillus sp. PvR098]MBP2441482.1 threonine synthase [Paenibacillus sp. PvP052]
MDFISTRGKVEKTGFIRTFLMGLGDDGGLMLPTEIPTIPHEVFKEWEQLSYQQLMLEIFSYFTNGEIPREELKDLIDESYSSFRSPEVTPVRKIHDSLYVLELFHGPTFAFKDIALQFMGNLYSYVSRKENEIINILGATSGDTGAAAIQGVKGKEGIRICILHPHQKVSKVQELQMTTVDDENVLNLSVHGNFDDCQRIIKELFADIDYKNKYHLRAINSINFVRILSQTVYYFYAYFQIAKKTKAEKISFSVPTGNFGNIFSAYLAKRMGLPIHRLVVATNENNILERFVDEGVYSPGDFRSTYSPSMDIQIASNFERYLYYLLDQNQEKVTSLMEQFQKEGKIVIDPQLLKKVQSDFSAHGVKNEECLHIISKYSGEYDYLADPHTACGIAAYESCCDKDEVCVTLATAHPAKFDESVQLCDISQKFPPEIQALFDKPQHMTVVDNSKQEISDQLKRFF